MAALDENCTIPLYDVNGNVIGTFELADFELEDFEGMPLEEARAAIENAK